MLLIVLAIPSISLIAVIVVDILTSCELNPWAGYTCASWFGPVVFMAMLGVVTLIPLVVIVIIIALTSPKLWRRLRASNEGPKK